MPNRVLVVDDSALMRRLITGVLTEAGYQVETAHTGKQGVEKLVQWQPDVVTLDINMPEMDGLTALSLMMAARPTPVIMVSSLTAEGALATLEALALGAVDFITKPGGTISLSIDDIRAQLLDKVRAASRSRPREASKSTLSPRTAPRPMPPKPAANRTSKVECPGIVLVGVSTGGPRTLEDILPLLPAEFPLPVMVCQHMPANFTDAFAQRMDRLCPLHVREVNAAIPIEPGNIYIGRGGTDMIVAERLGRLVALPKGETPGHPWHPSVDVMVDSAMKHVEASRLFGVMLTGMGNDGAVAMTELKRQGGRTIAESEATAVVFGMPQELINQGGATLVLPSNNIARQLKGWLL
jgi:two-component system chemotaxis response regulator CheB